MSSAKVEQGSLEEKANLIRRAGKPVSKPAYPWMSTASRGGGASLRKRRDPNALPPKTALAAAALLTVGVVLLLIGTRVLYMGDRERATSMIILGVIAFLPGSYASYILLGAFLKWRGFKYSQVPSYDD